MASPTTPLRVDWNEDELRASVRAYLHMMALEKLGQPFKKSALIDSLMSGALYRRSKGAIERRFQNVSAVMGDLRLPFVRGYPPLQNVGENVRSALLVYILELSNEFDELFLAPENSPELVAQVMRYKALAWDNPPEGQQYPKRDSRPGSGFLRDPRVKAWVLKQAAGNCEACGQVAPFMDANGEPYLEVHHVFQLSEGGSDRVTNAVALCPTCHRRCHFGSDRVEFSNQIYQSVARLVPEHAESEEAWASPTISLK